MTKLKSLTIVCNFSPKNVICVEILTIYLKCFRNSNLYYSSRTYYAYCYKNPITWLCVFKLHQYPCHARRPPGIPTYLKNIFLVLLGERICIQIKQKLEAAPKSSVQLKVMSICLRRSRSLDSYSCCWKPLLLDKQLVILHSHLFLSFY